MIKCNTIKQFSSLELFQTIVKPSAIGWLEKCVTEEESQQTYLKIYRRCMNF